MKKAHGSLKMLRPILKQKGSTKTEKYLAKLSEDTFFGLWSYPNIYTDEGISKTGQGRELCDLLVVFERKIIVFSDKDISFNSNIDLHVAWKRWFLKSVIRSSKQLYGAESWIKKYPDRLYLDKECKKKFPIFLNQHDYEIHLIAVTWNSYKAAVHHFGGESSGTFIQNYLYDESQCSEYPFTLGNFSPDKTFIHVLDKFSLDLLMTELDTASDFTDYLKFKEKNIKDRAVIYSSGEEEMLAYYFLKNNPFFAFSTTNEPILLSEGLWNNIKNSQEYELLCSERKKSYLWDRLIRHFTNHVLKATGYEEAKKIEFEYHERAVRKLSAENRLSRTLLSKAFIEKFDEVPHDKRSGRVVYSPDRPEKLFVFLFLPRVKGVIYNDCRSKRLTFMQQYLLVAKYLYPTAKDLVCISTEPKEAKGRSEDILSIEYFHDLTQEEKDEAKSLIKDKQILNDIFTSRISLFEERNKNNKPYRRMAVKYGRNEKCPCGSGKKYKKCCMRSDNNE
ncbi:MAG: YecA family protein [Candidatus Electrothrix sp. YB6]